MKRETRELSEKEEAIYGGFIQWLKNAWFGVPESESLLPYVAARYTPEEAEFLTGMPFAPKSLAELAELKTTDRAALKARLDELARKGLVYCLEKEGGVRYCLNDILFVFRTFGWPGRNDEYSRKVGPLQEDYFLTGFLDPWKRVTEKGLRVLPIGRAIEDSHRLLPYEEVARVLDRVEYFSVSHCPCRHVNHLGSNTFGCSYPTEVCLHFDRLGRYIVENGMGREITRREADEILQKCAELGLVHGISNLQEKPDTICNCCKCCCMWFVGLYRLRHSGSLTPSNYRVEASQETCIGCGLCVKRCPMDAIDLKDMPEAKGRKTRIQDPEKGGRDLINKTGRISQVLPDLCIGCGVCAYKCPSGSLALRRCEVEHHPPRTGRDWVVQFVAGSRAAE